MRARRRQPRVQGLAGLHRQPGQPRDHRPDRRRPPRRRHRGHRHRLPADPPAGGSAERGGRPAGAEIVPIVVVARSSRRCSSRRATLVARRPGAHQHQGDVDPAGGRRRAAHPGRHRLVRRRPPAMPGASSSGRSWPSSASSSRSTRTSRRCRCRRRSSTPTRASCRPTCTRSSSRSTRTRSRPRCRASSRPDPNLFNLPPVLVLGGVLVIACLVVAYSAWSWRIVAGRRATTSPPDPGDGLRA